jgi:alpha-mannosidase
MKKVIFNVVFLLLVFIGKSQINVPEFGRINYLKGYVKEIRGENINYFSALPDFANTALLSRCTDGNYAIEWETEAIPDSFSDKYVYFAWLVAYSKNTSEGDRRFDLYINDQKAVTFSTFKDKNLPSWTYSGAGGEALVFEYKMDDRAGDAHGYMYLKVPTSKVIKGRSVKLKVVGQKANSRDWYMTFKYAFADTLTISPVSLLTIDDQQPIQVLATHFGSEVPLVLDVEGERSYRFKLKPGLNSFEIFHSAVATAITIKVVARVQGIPAKEFIVNLKPITHREIHLIHHSHYDVGYSHLQAEVENIHNRNISNALHYIGRTRNLPAEARFKWNIETTLAIENFCKNADKVQMDELIRDIKDGSIGIGGLYANILTGLCQPEELFNLTRYACQLENDWGIQIPVAMRSDIPGLTWSVIPALARSGIRYFSDGPNYTGSLPYAGDRVGNSNNAWADKPFWWVSPSGNEKILFWMAGKGYSSWHSFKPGEISTPRGKKKISDYMDELDKKAYPYEMVQWRYNIVSDNGPTDSLISQFVLDWNQRYKSPKMILNTVERMFGEFEERYGNQLPVFKGDFTPYWEDGAYSSTSETAMNRRNSERLTALGTIYSIAAPSAYDVRIFDNAWNNVLLWDEHTWGAYNSISDPDLPFVTNQWNYKQHYVLKADSLISEIEKPLLTFSGSTLPGQIDVYNTSSWERKDVVYLDKDVSALLKGVTGEDGKPLTFQRLSDGRVVVLLTVPALGFKRLTLVRDDRQIDMEWEKPEVLAISNDKIDLQIDRETGSIRSIQYKVQGLEMITTHSYSGANEFLYVPGRDPGKAVTNFKPSCRLLEDGLVLSSLLIKGEAPGCKSLTRIITLFKELDRIEITNTIDKEAIREKESVHFAFPFAIPDAQERFNSGWGGIFQPGIDQMAGANQDYYSVQQWCDVSNQQCGVSLLLREACLVEPGTMVDEQTGKFGVKSWKTQPDTIPTLFSYVMNNYWHTNYKADQEGTVTVSYALVPHEVFNLTETQKQGMAFNQPFVVLPVSEARNPASLFTISDPGIFATSVLPLNNGFKIRLFNGGGAPENFVMEWGNIKPLSMKIRNAEGTYESLQPNSVLKLPAFGIMDVEVSE